MNERWLVELIGKEVGNTLQELNQRGNLQDGEQVADHAPSDRSQEIPIGVSNRHVHLSPQAVERLFGHRAQLTKLRDLSQPGQFACEETVTLIGPKGRIDRVRILGPARGDTQVEISLFDGYTLGITPPIRDSGNIENTPGIILQGPRGQLRIERGVICASRHIHMHPQDAERFGVKHGQRVQVRFGGSRGITMDHVLIRVSERYRLEMHIDLDEANAGNLTNDSKGIIFA